MVLVLAVVTALWLKEWTQRRARESADQFMGPLLGELAPFNIRFAPFLRGPDQRLRGPRWIFAYDSYFDMIGLAPHVDVDLFGRIREFSNLIDAEKLLRLSDEDRLNQQQQMLARAWRARIESQDKGTAEPAGGAYVAPEAGAPSAHP